MSARRTRQECTHARRHRHGTREMYEMDRCGCDSCRAANASYARRRRKLAASGRTPGGWVDAGPARQHVLLLRAAGIGRRRLAARSGVPEGVIHCLLNGRDGKPPTARVAPATAYRLLAVPMPTIDDLAPSALTGGTGTRRRLQALIAVGWPHSALADRLGWSEANLGRVLHSYGGGDVHARTHRAVAALYDRLWNIRPPGGRSAAAEQIAIRHGWVGPLAWDDDTIDDPATDSSIRRPGDDVVDVFAVQLVLDGQPMRLSGVDLDAAVQALAEAGHGFATIATRVGSDEVTVSRIRDKMLQRARRADAA